VLDRELDANRFIRPGLGDAGDRLFDTIGIRHDVHADAAPEASAVSDSA
jgi:hypothetical protein